MSFANDDCISPVALWSELPRDVLAEIAKRLPSRLDIQCFRGVCSSWRQSTPPQKPKYSSLRLPYPIDPIDPKCKGYLTIKERTIYCIEPPTTLDPVSLEGSNKFWFVRLQENKHGKMLAMNPLSGRFSSTLPNSFPKSVSLLDYRVREVSTTYVLVFVDNATDEEDKEFKSIKTAICDEGENRFSVMAMHRWKLYVWRTGEDKWENVNIGERIFPADFVCHNGKFYVISRTFFVIDPFTLTIQESIRGDDHSLAHGIRLIKSCGELFSATIRGMGYFYIFPDYPLFIYSEEDMIAEHLMRVFKLDEENRRWVCVDSLKEHAFFFGLHWSFSVSPEDFPWCRENCVYLDRRIARVGYEPVGFSSSFYFFWPPPAWLKP